MWEPFVIFKQDCVRLNDIQINTIMTRKLFYNVSHFIIIFFFPETIGWQHSRIRIVVDINTNIKTSPLFIWYA